MADPLSVPYRGYWGVKPWIGDGPKCKHVPFSTLSRVLGGETERSDLIVATHKTPFSTLSRVLGGETLARGLLSYRPGCGRPERGSRLSVPYRGYWGVKRAQARRADRLDQIFQYPIAGIGG